MDSGLSERQNGVITGQVFLVKFEYSGEFCANYNYCTFPQKCYNSLQKNIKHLFLERLPLVEVNKCLRQTESSFLDSAALIWKACAVDYLMFVLRGCAYCFYFLIKYERAIS
jgi:hypothetical protein